MPNIKEFDKWYAEYKAEPGVWNTHRFAMAVFEAGYACSQREPVNAVEVKAGQVLSRDERDSLIAANAFLITLQRGEEGTVFFHRIQKTISVISDMLYGK